jgi:hypothetical protein
LGNKRGVDIIVARKAGDAVTIEVKGTAKKYDWVINNLTSLNPERHFVVLASYEDRIGDPAMPASRVWVLPFPDVEPFRRTYKGNMKTRSRAQMLQDGKKYASAGLRSRSWTSRRGGPRSTLCP